MIVTRRWLVSRRCRAHAVAVVISVAVLTAGAEAQTLLGTLVDQETADPIAGAFLTLRTADGRVVDAGLTWPDGRFVLRAPGDGTFRVTTEVVGFETPRPHAVELVPGGAGDLRIEIPLRPVRLDGVSTSSGGPCLPLTASDTGTAALWEEIRKALTVLAWAEGNEALEVEGARYERTLLPESHLVAQHAESNWKAVGNPGSGMAPEMLAAGGFVQESEDGYLDYRMPDAATLLSDAFLSAHCFGVAGSSRVGEGFTGLLFQPIQPDGERPGIQGVLSLDRTSAGSMRLDYSYTRLPGIPPSAWSVAEGLIRFDRLATGAWITRRWRLRMPVVGVGEGAERGETSVLLVQETGGEALGVSMADGRRVELAPLRGTLSGVVSDSATGRPLAGARVTVLPIDREAVADQRGRFELSGLPGGVFQVSVQHPMPDFDGVEEVREAAIVAGLVTDLPVRMRPIADVVATICDDALGPDAGRGSVLLHGTVATRSGEPAPGSVVRIAGTGPHSGQVTQVMADDGGEFRVCLAPSDAPVAVSAIATQEVGQVAPGRARLVSLAEPGLVGVDLVLPGPASAGAVRAEAAVAAGTWANVILGTVVAGEDHAPIPGAMVRLMDVEGALAGSTITDGSGHFRLTHPDRGHIYEIMVEHLGYASTGATVHFDRTTQLRMGIELSTQPIELAPIVVTEQRRGRLAQVGFDERRSRGFGTFVEVDDFMRARASRVTDFVRNQTFIPHPVQVNQFGDEDLVLVPLCRGFPAVYIDGMLVRQGGAPPPRTSLRNAPPPSPPALSTMVPPSAVAAVEVYRRASQVPPRWRGVDAGCGVIVIWTH